MNAVCGVDPRMLHSVPLIPIPLQAGLGTENQDPEKCFGSCLELRTEQRPGRSFPGSCQFKALLNKRVLRCSRAACWLWQGRSQYWTLVKAKYSAWHPASHTLGTSAIQTLLGRERRKGTLLPHWSCCTLSKALGQNHQQKIKLACSSVLP